MRKIIDEQLKFGEVPIDQIKFDIRCRDEMTKILIGLQHIYCNKEIREKVFKKLEAIIPENVDKSNGRNGMELWKILVLGVVRLNGNMDFDKLKDQANNHKSLREMLGHSSFLDEYKYPMQTLKDNLSLLTPEVLKEINKIVVDSGHEELKKKDEKLKTKVDSFVVETNVHYPTDINLLFDAIRKVIQLIAKLCLKMDISDWRQSVYNIKQIKRSFNKVRKMKRSSSKDTNKKSIQAEKIKQAHSDYIEMVSQFLDKAIETITKITGIDKNIPQATEEISKYISHAKRQIEQIKRRVLEGEKIPTEEKVYSIFEKHTEWISKGKAGVPQELGLRVSILEDDNQFILNHIVMEKETDEKISVRIVQEAKTYFQNIHSCSFDKGYYTPENKKILKEILDYTVMPKKGKLSAKDKEEEHSEEFISLRHKHSGVESAINGLEHSGLNRCLDHGIEGFKRYVGIAILSRNLHRLGKVLQEKEKNKINRIDKYRKTMMDNANKIAA